MPQKNSLHSIKVKQDQVLPSVTPQQPPAEPPPVPTRAVKPAQTQRPTDSRAGRAGRPKKAAADKENKTISLRLTAKEYAAIEQQAGLVPLATYVKHELKTKTNLF